MVKLAAWSIDARHIDEDSQQLTPKRVEQSHIGLERHLEDWIVNDVSLIGEGYTLVGRQVTIDDGRLDLLAIDSQDRWVVIEIKPGLLESGALRQSLYYASSLAQLDSEELFGKLKAELGKFGDEKRLSDKVRQQLEGEEEREIAILLVGAGIHAGLDRMTEFLARFEVPIGVVSFEVFTLDDGPQLLIRETVDEPTKPKTRRTLTVEAIRGLAENAGVREQFDRFVEMSKRAGLPVQPQPASVRIAPPANRTRYLMYASPRRSADSGELHISASPKNFSDWFSHINEDQAIDAIGAYDAGVSVTGKELDECLDQIECFLKEHFPQ